jgi:hypothetical protein
MLTTVSTEKKKKKNAEANHTDSATVYSLDHLKP